ncbi:MAG: Haloacid dehalogenase domain protein hydrolase [Planctomycetaceae bacterium]|nr:Haloacid dehalogenase domain protein hydrolase [Planctomycetaceae bacterium]
MSSNPLEQMSKKHQFLVAIDSDGCAFDSMEIKHKECFIPPFIKHMGLQAVSKYARECCEFANLYSKDRGANRFPAYLKALDLLAERPEVQARGARIPTLQGVRDWIKRESKLGTKTIVPEAERSGDPDLKIAAAWSQEVDDTVKAIVHGVPPFPLLRESLEEALPKADIIVCSATPTGALQKEWQEHDIAKYVGAICGQEVGSKKEILAAAKAKGWSADKIIMIGDAPGDMAAALSNACRYFPINPGHEEQSWYRFFNESLERFFAGTYAGAYEAELIAEFDKYLPEVPPWKR